MTRKRPPCLKVRDHGHSLRKLATFEAYCGSGSWTRPLFINHGARSLMLDIDASKMQWDQGTPRDT